VTAPSRGYVVPAAYASEVGAKLRLHGIAYELLQKQTLDVQTFRASSVQFGATPFEGRMRATLRGDWRTETRKIPSDSLLVPISQLRARLLMALLEPQAPDSLAAWGFFNGCFEQKEHMEPYVAEHIGRQMLNRDSAMAAEFQHRLNTDSQFAANPSARLEFFLRRHASWDDHFNLYPVHRV
jgi:hypothetical protein